MRQSGHPSTFPAQFLGRRCPRTLGTVYLILFGVLPWQKMDGIVFKSEQITSILQLLNQKITALIATYPNLKDQLTLLPELGRNSWHLSSPLSRLKSYPIFSAGASFGHVLVGIGTDDSFVVKRLSALGRLLLRPLSCATVIGELLPLWEFAH